MYQSHFHLNDRPFASAPNPEHYFPGASIERARESLTINIERASGTAMIVGSVGVGKTLLCQLVANQFCSEFPVCILYGARLCDRSTMLQVLLHQLGLPYHSLSEGEMRLTLFDHVAGQACPRGILLIVDEADRLRMELLEELRVITNLVRDGQPRVRMVLTGAPRLEERVGHPQMESLNQRVVCRLYLESFSPEETAEYMQARITSCGGDATALFTEEAYTTVYRATSGVPRLINQLCDHALVLGTVEARDLIDKHAIEEAWADLQQLPVPQETRFGSKRRQQHDQPTKNSIIEFGPLDDDDSDDDDSVDTTIAAEDKAGSSSVPRPYHSRKMSDFASFGESAVEWEADEIAMDASGSIELIDTLQDRLNSLDHPESSSISHFANESGWYAIAGEQVEIETSYQVRLDFPPGADEYGEFPSSSEDQAHCASQLTVELSEPISESSEAASTEKLELTMEQATNPFDEPFAEEEIVLQQFSSPSKLARRDVSEVTSIYSSGLAARLMAAHPGLRMHPSAASHTSDSPKTRDGFQTLSQYWSEEQHLVQHDSELELSPAETSQPSPLSEPTSHEFAPGSWDWPSIQIVASSIVQIEQPSTLVGEADPSTLIHPSSVPKPTTDGVPSFDLNPTVLPPIEPSFDSECDDLLPVAWKMGRASINLGGEELDASESAEVDVEAGADVNAMTSDTAAETELEYCDELTDEQEEQVIFRFEPNTFDPAADPVLPESGDAAFAPGVIQDYGYSTEFLHDDTVTEGSLATRQTRPAVPVRAIRPHKAQQPRRDQHPYGVVCESDDVRDSDMQLEVAVSDLDVDRDLRVPAHSSDIVASEAVSGQLAPSTAPKHDGQVTQTGDADASEQRQEPVLKKSFGSLFSGMRRRKT